MFKNAFANLQKVGKSLMLPVSVLPIAGILLGVGSANFSWLPAVVSHVMAEAGGSVFANMPLIFAIGVALGFTNNDGVSALAAVVAYGIMVKTMAVVAPLVLHLPAEEIAAKHLADTGVLGGIISVRSQRICLTASTVSNCLSIWASLRVSASCRSFRVWPLFLPV
ncbi:PTS system glucose-specific transporter subunits IIBC [Salmonella enterica subsp. diarizonae]|uniref:PTS system glucose-specific transporter subunits IIBC n=1 Tax=Salmonella diarizonae TaxID=59204 RepID=A0A379U0C9_SALDZ|nr:PTS system glucose-specific transporter subunits IIBC [Salmonella enterica subsp. diarizonae]